MAKALASRPRINIVRDMNRDGAEGVFEALHAGRIKGALTEEALLDVADASVISALKAEGLLRVGRRGTMLTPAGLVRHARLLEEQRAAVDLAPLVVSYERFLPINAQVLSVCSAWQESEGDREALFHTAHLLEIYLGEASPVLRLAAELLQRFGRYADRLAVAAEHAMAGEARYITSPHVDSFHNVWFECHEDYLVTLGLERDDDETSP